MFPFLLLLPFGKLELVGRDGRVALLSEHGRVHERRVVLVHRLGREDLSVLDQSRVEVHDRDELERDKRQSISKL